MINFISNYGLIMNTYFQQVPIKDMDRKNLDGLTPPSEIQSMLNDYKSTLDLDKKKLIMLKVLSKITNDHRNFCQIIEMIIKKVEEKVPLNDEENKKRRINFLNGLYNYLALSKPAAYGTSYPKENFEKEFKNILSLLGEKNENYFYELFNNKKPYKERSYEKGRQEGLISLLRDHRYNCIVVIQAFEKKPLKNDQEFINSIDTSKKGESDFFYNIWSRYILARTNSTLTQIRDDGDTKVKSVGKASPDATMSTENYEKGKYKNLDFSYWKPIEQQYYKNLAETFGKNFPVIIDRALNIATLINSGDETKDIENKLNMYFDALDLTQAEIDNNNVFPDIIKKSNILERINRYIADQINKIAQYKLKTDADQKTYLNPTTRDGNIIIKEETILADNQKTIKDFIQGYEQAAKITTKIATLLNKSNSEYKSFIDIEKYKKSLSDSLTSFENDLNQVINNEINYITLDNSAKDENNAYDYWTHLKNAEYYTKVYTGSRKINENKTTIISELNKLYNISDRTGLIKNLNDIVSKANSNNTEMIIQKLEENTYLWKLHDYFFPQQKIGGSDGLYAKLTGNLREQALNKQKKAKELYKNLYGEEFLPSKACNSDNSEICTEMTTGENQINNSDHKNAIDTYNKVIPLLEDEARKKAEEEIKKLNNYLNKSYDGPNKDKHLKNTGEAKSKIKTDPIKALSDINSIWKDIATEKKKAAEEKYLINPLNNTKYTEKNVNEKYIDDSLLKDLMDNGLSSYNNGIDKKSNDDFMKSAEKYSAAIDKMKDIDKNLTIEEKKQKIADIENNIPPYNYMARITAYKSVLGENNLDKEKDNYETVKTYIEEWNNSKTFAESKEYNDYLKKFQIFDNKGSKPIGGYDTNINQKIEISTINELYKTLGDLEFKINIPEKYKNEFIKAITNRLVILSHNTLKDPSRPNDYIRIIIHNENLAQKYTTINDYEFNTYDRNMFGSKEENDYLIDFNNNDFISTIEKNITNFKKAYGTFVFTTKVNGVKFRVTYCDQINIEEKGIFFGKRERKIYIITEPQNNTNMKNITIPFGIDDESEIKKYLKQLNLDDKSQISPIFEAKKDDYLEYCGFTHENYLNFDILDFFKTNERALKKGDLKKSSYFVFTSDSGIFAKNFFKIVAPQTLTLYNEELSKQAEKIIEYRTNKNIDILKSAYVDFLNSKTDTFKSYPYFQSSPFANYSSFENAINKQMTTDSGE